MKIWPGYRYHVEDEGLLLEGRRTLINVFLTTHTHTHSVVIPPARAYTFFQRHIVALSSSNESVHVETYSIYRLLYAISRDCGDGGWIVRGFYGDPTVRSVHLTHRTPPHGISFSITRLYIHTYVGLFPFALPRPPPLNPPAQSFCRMLLATDAAPAADVTLNGNKIMINLFNTLLLCIQSPRLTVAARIASHLHGHHLYGHHLHLIHQHACHSNGSCSSSALYTVLSSCAIIIVIIASHRVVSPSVARYYFFLLIRRHFGP